jgi:sirohydrochlorin cobaltochelatase
MKQCKSVLAVILALAFTLSLAACGTPAASTPTARTVKPVLLAVSFGTSYNDSRDITIGAIENALATAYPQYEVRRAFTSQIIIDILKDRDKLEIDNVTEAMDRLVADGVTDVVIQPTHVMNGYEYDDVIAEVTAYKEKFDSFKIGDPLLISDADYDKIVSAITTQTAAYDADGRAVVFMGHGTEHESNATYDKLQQKLTDAGHNNYFIGTVEAEPTVEEVLALAKASGATKVVLLPLMIVAGDHANNDMAGDEEDSWKSIFEAAGFEVECVLQGLGQNTAIQQMFVEHAAAAIAQ